jgi:hypothetical protein
MTQPPIYVAFAHCLAALLQRAGGMFCQKLLVLLAATKNATTIQ